MTHGDRPAAGAVAALAPTMSAATAGDPIAGHLAPKTRAAGAARQTLDGLIAARAAVDPAAPAILSPGRRALTFAELVDQIDATARALNSLGIGRGDRLALVLPTGPELATALIATAAATTAAPLNSALTGPECAAMLPALRPTALLVAAGTDPPARAVARDRAIPVFELRAGDVAGRFALSGPALARAVDTSPSRPGDVALLMHTSGTTDRPKRVPLTHANLTAAARATGGALGLTPDDRGMALAPIFHISPIGNFFASLVAGASFICPPAFDPDRVFAWLDECRPTWFMAAPAMHRAILDRAPIPAGPPAALRLRFVRSGAASLPPALLSEIEDLFGAPVLEGYGMTEACPAITTNPLPPRPRKPGSVGCSVGPAIAIADEMGSLLPPNQTGEIVIRGATVMSGYDDDPQATRQAFTAEGWFRSGDLGHLDPEGYLFVTGRLKELVNRGGEKVAPREVEEVLLAHPAVAQAIAFAVPHAQLGEEVAAAVVLHPDHPAGERELRAFAAERLAPFKVPRRVVVVAAIPTSPTGKVRRVELASLLGLSAAASGRSVPAATIPPRTADERCVAAVWSEVLGQAAVGVDDDFLTLGGDSLLATRVLTRLNDRLGVELPVAPFYAAATVAEQARLVAACRNPARQSAGTSQ